MNFCVCLCFCLCVHMRLVDCFFRLTRAHMKATEKNKQRKKFYKKICISKSIMTKNRNIKQMPSKLKHLIY